MIKSRFRKTELRLTGAYLARRWAAQVTRFSGASAYISWLAHQQLSTPARREFIELAAGNIRRVSPLRRRVEFDLILSSLSDSLLSFKELNETCWSRYAALIPRLQVVVVEQMCNALPQLAFNQNSAAVLKPGPWGRMDEAEAVARKLDHYVVPWDDLEQALGIDVGSLSGEIKLREEDTVGQPQDAGDGSGLDDAVHTSSSSGPNPGLVAEVDAPSHSGQRLTPPPPTLSFSERLREAIAAGRIKTGAVLHLPTSPIAFLKDVPVLDGGLVDEFSVRLAEYGARPSQDDRPGWKASGRDGRPRPDKRWSKISKEFDGLQRQHPREHGRGLLNLQNYLAWPRRQTRDDVSISNGVMLGSLLDWILGELRRLLSDSLSGSADAESQTEETGESDDTAGPQALGLTYELANVLNIDLSRQARDWSDQLEAIKGEAKEVRRLYTAGYARVRLAPMPALVDRLDLLVRRVSVLSAFCFATYQLAWLVRVWTSGSGRKDVGLFFEREAGSPVRLRADDADFGWMFVLAQISRAALSRWSDYLLPLFQAAALGLGNELLSLLRESTEHLMWIQVGSTFDKLSNDLRQELGCPQDLETGVARTLSELAKINQARLSAMERVFKM